MFNIINENSLKNKKIYNKINLDKYPDIELSDFDKIYISKELNNNLTKQERKIKYLKKYIGDYCFIIKNNGFNNYQIKGIIKIDEQPKFYGR